MFLKKFKFEIDLLWVHPLSKIWAVVKSARLCHEDSVENDFKKIQVFVEQVVLLLGQASNSIFCYRRLYMLQALTDSQQQRKQMMRDDSELLQVNGKNLFENKFRENMCHTSKSKKQTIEMLSNISQTKHKPFCHGLPQTPRRSFGGKQQQKHLLRLGTTSQYSKKNDTAVATKTAMDTDIVNIKQETLFNKVEFSYVVPVEDLKHIFTHPYIKSLFCARKSLIVQLAGRLNNFIENWKILINDT